MTLIARVRSCAGLLALTALLGCAAIGVGGMPGGALAATAKTPCTHRSFEGAWFIVCTFDANTEELRLVSTGADGAALRSFIALEAALGSDAARVAFAMNAGMFQEDGTAAGLLIENGVARHAVNTASGPGNFHMKPNGVFSLDAASLARVETTEAYIARGGAPKWATQSGPMLVIAGRLHPKISRDGPSKYVRNGVGVNDAHTALFVISDTVISFGKLARFFRDKLHCKDALYFDGHISSLWAPSLKRQDAAFPLGPMVVVLSQSQGAQSP